MSAISHSNSGRFNPWPVSIISFFALAIVGCGTFVAFCTRHPADLISPNYYEEEVRYQGQIDRLQQTQESAPLASIAYDATARQIRVSMPADSPTLRLTGQIQLYRPSAMNMDRALKLELDPKGVQAIDAAGLLPGLWKVRVFWTVDNRQFFLNQQVVIPGSAPRFEPIRPASPHA